MSRRLFLLIVEYALIFACGLAALYTRFADQATEVLVDERAWLKLLLSVMVFQGSLYLFDLYEFSTVRMRSLLVIRILQSLGFSAIILAIVFDLLPKLEISRSVSFVHLLLTAIVMTVWRLLLMQLLRSPRFAERVLIVGTDRRAVDLARELLARSEEGFHVVGFVGNDPGLVGRSLINPRVVGMVSELEKIVHRYRAQRIVIAVGDERGRLPLDSLLELKLRDDVAVEESAAFYERVSGKISTEQLRPSQLIFANSSPWQRFYRRWRPVAGVLLALFGFALAFPVMVLIAIAIKLDSRGPVFYTQRRVGFQGRVFEIIKFRSMRTDAEAEGPKWADAKDPRITRVGRIIRKLRLDELPQLLNIIRGEMSFIGPRPERPFFVELLEQRIPYYSQRHLVKPGLTGWAQVRYPYGASIEDAIVKLQYDLYYIKNQSLALDASILFETARIVLFGRLAH